MTTRTIHERHVGWDRDLTPVGHVAPGDTVAFDVIDASGGQLTPGAGPEQVARMDGDRVNPTCGPVHVEGAAPGDALRVEILDFAPSAWGWTAVIPGFGLLADDFPDPAIAHWSVEAGGLAHTSFGAVPVEPFPGTIGVAPAEPGPHSVIPPRRVGGNLDVRDLRAGTVLWLPVEVEGALLSVGDTHAAQGDGEVCGTAIESPMRVELRIDVEHAAAPAAPRYETTVPRRGALDAEGELVTTGVGPDLMGCARDAVQAMIELLGTRYGLDPVAAYMLCSVATDLRISEVVDAPNWVVACALPKALPLG